MRVLRLNGNKFDSIPDAVCKAPLLEELWMQVLGCALRRSFSFILKAMLISGAGKSIAALAPRDVITISPNFLGGSRPLGSTTPSRGQSTGFEGFSLEQQ